MSLVPVTDHVSSETSYFLIMAYRLCFLFIFRDISFKKTRWKMPWSALNDDCFCCIYTLNARPSLFTMTWTFVIFLKNKSLSICIRVHKEEKTTDPAHNLLTNLPQKETQKRYWKVKGMFVKKDQNSPSPKDTAVYLQRDRARWKLKRKRCSVPLQTCEQTQTHM